MVCLQDAVLFLRKRKTEKDVGLPCTGKGNIGGRKLKEKLEGKKREKYSLETETALPWRIVFYFFNEKEFSFLILGEVGAEFIETS